MNVGRSKVELRYGKLGRMNDTKWRTVMHVLIAVYSRSELGSGLF